jgi:hypothetical protein
MWTVPRDGSRLRQFQNRFDIQDVYYGCEADADYDRLSETAMSEKEYAPGQI